MHPGIIAAATPDKPAAIMSGTGAALTYAQLDRRSLQVANLLRASAVAEGDHVAFQLHNSLDFFEALWGAHRAGAVYTAISTRLGVDETAYIAADCGAKVLAVASDLHAGLVDLAPAVADIRLRLGVGPGELPPGWAPWEEATGVWAATPVASRAGSDMLYSSGTTGRPKGVEQANPSLALDEADPLTVFCQLVLGFDDATMYLSPAPLYHAAPLRYSRSAQRLGGTVVQMEHFDAEQFLALVERYGITHTQMVPTMFVRLLKLPAEVRARYDLSSLRAVVHAAAPCPVPVKQRMIDWWGPIIWEYYAGTEGNGLVLCSATDWLAHPGTVGRPISGEVHIVGDDGLEAPRNTTGSVYFAGGSEFRYHNDPDKTAEAYNPKGWSTIGDIGHLDDDGWLFLTDRKANMIISGGVNIYPQEAENILSMHPKVADVAVFGVPNSEMGEEVKAVVQPADWGDAGPDLELDLLSYCRDRLAHFKCPRSVDFDPQLPRHPTGKLYKRLLKDRYWEGSSRI